MWIYIENVQVVYAKALEHLNANTTSENGIDKENAYSEERHRVLKLDVVSSCSERTYELEQRSKYYTHGNKTQEEHHGHRIRPSCLLRVSLQRFLRLILVTILEVFCEELCQIGVDLFALVRCEESVFLDFREELFFDYVVLELEMCIGEFYEDLLNCYLIDFCIGIEPFEFLVNFYEDSAPVCSKFKLIFCVRDAL